MILTVNAPKKYADARRTVITDEWKVWEAARHEAAIEDGWEDALNKGLDPEMFFPERADKAIPEEGAWIIVLEEPHSEVKDRFRVPLLSMWRARSHELNHGGFVGSTGVKFHPKQAVISTPGGDLHLWPHEYIVAKEPMALASEPEAELHSLGGEPVVDAEALFYLQSRGIPHQTAVMMLFNTVQSLDFVYVTFPDWVTSVFAGVGQSLQRYIALNPR
jgi:hypothetical protein